MDTELNRFDDAGTIDFCHSGDDGNVFEVETEDQILRVRLSDDQVVELSKSLSHRMVEIAKTQSNR